MRQGKAHRPVTGRLTAGPNAQGRTEGTAADEAVAVPGRSEIGHRGQQAQLDAGAAYGRGLARAPTNRAVDGSRDALVPQPNPADEVGRHGRCPLGGQSGTLGRCLQRAGEQRRSAPGDVDSPLAVAQPASELAQKPRAARAQPRRPRKKQGALGEVDVQRVGLLPQKGIAALHQGLKHRPQRLEGRASFSRRGVACALAAPELIQELGEALFPPLHTLDFGVQGDGGVLEFHAASRGQRPRGLRLPQLAVEKDDHRPAGDRSRDQEPEHDQQPGAPGGLEPYVWPALHCPPSLPRGVTAASACRAPARRGRHPRAPRPTPGRSRGG